MFYNIKNDFLTINRNNINTLDRFKIHFVTFRKSRPKYFYLHISKIFRTFAPEIEKSHEFVIRQRT